MNLLKVKCAICDKVLTTDIALSHEVEHFIPELIDYTKMQDGIDLNCSAGYKCHQCAYTTSEDLSGIGTTCLNITGKILFNCTFSF